MPQITYPGVHIEEAGAAPAIAGVSTATAAFVGATGQGPVAVPTPVRSVADFERTFGGLVPGLTLGHAVRHFFGNGGADALVVRAAADGTVDSALAALESATFNLLCVPPPRDGVDLPAASRAAAAELCRKRRALFIVDPSQAWQTAAHAAAGLDAFFPQRGAESALYFPFLQMADPLAGGQVRAFAPCGAVAGVIARTDRNRGVWKAPAGLDAVLNGVVAPAIVLGDRDNEALNPLGINVLRKFAQGGTVVWGARTLVRTDRGDSDYKYVPVRRFASFIEDSVSSGLQGTVFEPNTEASWARLRLAVGSFLQALFRQGAMAGRTPREAYFVKCDGETTSAADIVAGRANLVVGFAPLKPAEFVILKFSLAMAAGEP